MRQPLKAINIFCYVHFSMALCGANVISNNRLLSISQIRSFHPLATDLANVVNEYLRTKTGSYSLTIY